MIGERMEVSVLCLENVPCDNCSSSERLMEQRAFVTLSRFIELGHSSKLATYKPKDFDWELNS